MILYNWIFLYYSKVPKRHSSVQFVDPRESSLNLDSDPKAPPQAETVLPTTIIDDSDPLILRRLLKLKALRNFAFSENPNGRLRTTSEGSVSNGILKNV